MKYVVRMYSVTCPEEDCIIAVADTEQEALDIVAKEKPQYSDKQVFEVEELYS